MFRKLRLGLVYELARITGHWGTELGCGCIFVCSGIRSTALLMLWVLIPPPPHRITRPCQGRHSMGCL